VICPIFLPFKNISAVVIARPKSEEYAAAKFI